MNDNQKKILFSLIGVLILICAVVGISYAMWRSNFFGVKENSLITGNVSFSYTESDTNVISIEDALPMDDEKGIKQTASNTMFDFSVSAKTSLDKDINYEVFTIDKKGNTLDDKYIKVYLTDQNDNVLGSDSGVKRYSSFSKNDSGNGRILYKSKLTKDNSSQKLRLRIWLASDYENGKASKDIFKFTVNVKGYM